MPLRPSLILLAILLTVPTSARTSAGSAVCFVFTGTVTQPGGKPVPGARVALEGVPAATATADAEGRYAFTHAVPDVAAETPLRLVLRASHGNWHLALPSGEASLAVELRRVPAAGGGARIEVRANDAGAAKTVALALAAGGEAVVALEARFMRLVGREDRSAPVLAALEVAELAAPAAKPMPVPAPATVPAQTAPPERRESLRLFPGAPDPAPSPPAAMTDSTPAPASPAAVTDSTPAPPPAAPVPTRAAEADTAVRPGIRVSVRPETPARGAGPLLVALGRAVRDPGPAGPGAGDCGCQVSGTVEVRGERPVHGRPRVVVSLAGRPAPRDTVAIFMGPPRAFYLGLVPCGRHRLEVRPLGARLARVEPDSMDFTCAAGNARHFRVVLERR